MEPVTASVNVKQYVYSCIVQSRICEDRLGQINIVMEFDEALILSAAMEGV